MSLSLLGVLSHSKNILVLRSPVIESLHHSLAELFFGESGIFKTQVGPSSLLSAYPTLMVNHNSLDGRADVWISYEVYKKTFNDWKNQILLNLQKMKQIFLENSEQELKICYEAGINLEITELVKGHSMQLVSSLLSLWRDFVVSSGKCNYEESRLQILKTALEKLSEKQGLGWCCEALKEMVLSMKEIDLEDSKNHYSFKSCKRVLVQKSQFCNGLKNISLNTIIRIKNMGQLKHWLYQLSDYNFIYVVCLLIGRLPKAILQDLLETQSVHVLIKILIKNPILVINNLLFDLLKKVLTEMLKKDFVELLQNISIEMLIGILTKIPRDLLGHVLLELPENILCELNLKISSVPLKQEIDQCLTELKIAYQLRQDALEVEESPVPSLLSLRVPSLLSLAVTKICQASNRCLVGREGLSLSSTYVDRMLLQHPELQQEVCDKVRIIVDHSMQPMQLTFGESQGQNYLSELDLLPLASMMSGYEDFIKETLLTKCVHH